MNPAGFEPAAFGFVDRRSCSAELRVPKKSLEEGAGVEPTRVFNLRRFSRPLGVPMPNLPNMTVATRLQSAALLIQLTPLLVKTLVHGEGLEPSHPRRKTVLQTAAIAALPPMLNSVIVKKDEGRDRC